MLPVGGWQHFPLLIQECSSSQVFSLDQLLQAQINNHECIDIIELNFKKQVIMIKRKLSVYQETVQEQL